MAPFLTKWFRWFEEGIHLLRNNEREVLFSTCGRNCADTGIIKVYEKLFEESGKELDVFFSRLHEIDNVGGRVVDAGKVYEITFPNCACDLHTCGYVHSDWICECSKQSILYIMETLVPDRSFCIDIVSTVLGGAAECRFRVTLLS